jgi:pimeloyl-ACP methyl ester carboxylesterase
MIRSLTAAAALLALSALPAQAQLARSEQRVTVTSKAPGHAGKTAQIYVRGIKAVGPSKGVVLFVHGAGTPAEVAFDPAAPGYSWMAFLARAGFDVFSMDMEGYGPSTRPVAMSNPCFLSPESQKRLIPAMLKDTCSAPSTTPITTMTSDWVDIGAVVDQLLKQNGLKQLAIVAWSQGGPRAAGYAVQHPDKISRLVILAPAYNPTMPAAEPDPLPAVPYPLTAQSQTEFLANWDRQAPCKGQYEPAVAQAVWGDLIGSDPAGAKWGPGVRRAPAVPSWGFDKTVAARISTPFLMISGETDKQVVPQTVRALYADLGSRDKVFIDLACSSHNAMWETNHLLLYQASLDWLTTGKVDGQSQGMLKKGY